MDVFSLRVNRTHAGRLFPFDRVYLVRHEKREVIEQLFRYAIVMPVDTALLDILLQLTPDEFVYRHQTRQEDEGKKKSLGDKAAASWGAQMRSGEWVMAVPILTKWAQKHMQNLPRYLTAKNYYAGAKGKAREAVSPYSNLTYLQLPGKKVRPVCVICPRFINHQNGECQPGQKVCYESLGLGLQSHFAEGLQAPEPAENVLEEFIEVEE